MVVEEALLAIIAGRKDIKSPTATRRSRFRRILGGLQKRVRHIPRKLKEKKALVFQVPSTQAKKVKRVLG